MRPTAPSVPLKLKGLVHFSKAAVDLTGDEDPTDEDEDNDMGDPTRGSVSLGGVGGIICLMSLPLIISMILGYKGLRKPDVQAAYKLKTHVISANAIEQTIFKFHMLKIEKEYERSLAIRFPACSIAAGRRVTLSTTIIDVHGVGLSNLTKPVIELIRRLQQINTYYPDTLNQMFIINAASRSKMLWSVV
ncbi:phosphatidylinositol/phosphatidylcholine transfer protein SFH6-like protein [Tanacetum coccineum]